MVISLANTKCIILYLKPYGRMSTKQQETDRYEHTHIQYTLYGLLTAATQSEQKGGTGETEQMHILHVDNLLR
jgi:hypothetical protein